MPSTSPKQHNAMEAAAHGNSTLGIPQSVGADFVAADKQSGQFAHNAPVPHADADHSHLTRKRSRP